MNNKIALFALSFVILAGAGCITNTQAKDLNLSDKVLTHLPSYVTDMTSLETLNISGTGLIDALPAEIGHLKNLRVLDASNNAMTGVPSEIGQLTNLEELNFNNNKLTGIPSEIGNLKKLKVLNLAGNSIAQLDLDGIRNSLPNLQVIQ